MVVTRPPVAAAIEVDGLRPGAVSDPSSPEALASELAAAARERRAVIAVGGGRALCMGDPPTAFDLALLTTRLDRVVEYRPEDFSVTVQAGFQLEELAALLRAQGQFVTLDPPGGPGHTVGGILASGLAGLLRLRQGTLSDQLLGLTVALPDGSLAKSGSRVLKSVAGYDLHKLHVGALGCFGVIVEVSLRTWTLPACEAAFEVDAGTAAVASAMAARALAIRPAPEEVVVVGGRGIAWSVRARFAGPVTAVESAAGRLGWQPSSRGSWDCLDMGRAPVCAIVTAPPQQLLGLLAPFDPEGLLASPALGAAYVLCAPDASALTQLRRAAEAAGGALALFSAPLEIKRAVGTWGRPTASQPLLRRIREVFDPERTLSPGRN